MIKFKDYIWQRIRKGMLLTWITLSGTSIIAYTGTMAFQKHKQLAASLRVAAYTVRESMEAGDWNLALGHLMALERNGPVFHIQLSGNTDQYNNLTGPFGIKPFGLGSICKTNDVADGIMLSGCMILFGSGEIITFVLFVLLATGLSFLLLMIFSEKSSGFVDTISNELKKMRHLEISQNTSSNEEIAEIISIREYILLLLSEAKEASKAVAVSQLSAQVAHDIRSPLTALDMVLNDIADIPEKKRLLTRNAVRRIHDIANNLLQHYNHINNGTCYSINTENKSFLVSMLDPLLSEKGLQYQQHNIKFDLIVDPDAYILYSKVNHIEFKRMISNLINNSVESIKHSTGRIIVFLTKENDMALIRVIDNGCGIHPDILFKLSSPNLKEMSFGKSDGHGLGLSQAYSVTKAWGGHFTLESNIESGTTVNIRLPLSPPPKWLKNCIEIVPSQTIVIFDDDASIHEVWSQRLTPLVTSHGIKTEHFSCPDELLNWAYNQNEKLHTHQFFIDYEIIGSNKSGLDLINTLQIQSNAILVTSRHEENTVIDQCKISSVSILPKSIVAFIPIQLVEQIFYDAVLIDDDTLIHQAWEIVSNEQHKAIIGFTSHDQFFSQHRKICKNSSIYIDSNLGNDIQGEVIVEEIYKLGYHKIYLTTGMPASHFPAMPHLCGIISKSPPW